MTFNIYVPINDDDIERVNLGLSSEFKAYYSLDDLIDIHGENQLYMIMKYRNIHFERKYGIGFFEN